jgi:two-component system phosphate regulon sensor histidine kinase PhoR
MEATDQRAPTRQNPRHAIAGIEPQLAEVKSRFCSAAAHDLRTPLTTIVGYLEMLLDEEFGPLAEDQREPLQVMQESALNLRVVINDLIGVLRANQK